MRVLSEAQTRRMVNLMGAEVTAQIPAPPRAVLLKPGRLVRDEDGTILEARSSATLILAGSRKIVVDTGCEGEGEAIKKRITPVTSLEEASAGADLVMESEADNVEITQQTRLWNDACGDAVAERIGGDGDPLRLRRHARGRRDRGLGAVHLGDGSRVPPQRLRARVGDFTRESTAGGARRLFLEVEGLGMGDAAGGDQPQRSSGEQRQLDTRGHLALS